MLTLGSKAELLATRLARKATKACVLAHPRLDGGRLDSFEFSTVGTFFSASSVPYRLDSQRRISEGQG